MGPNTRIAPVVNWGTLQVQTAAAGATYTALPNRRCRVVTLRNDTETDIQIRRAGTTDDPYTLPDSAVEPFPVVSNANEIEVRRADSDDTQVTLTAHWDD